MSFFLILVINFSERDEFTNKPEIILQFAEQLESEGDYYRAISEYKRFNYFCNDKIKRDSILYKISNLYLKMGEFENALITINKLQGKEENKYILELGKIYFLAGDYESARGIWGKNDTLIGWTYLREQNFTKAKYYLGFNDNPQLKKTYLAALFSGVMPGLGRIYAGRTGDGIYSFITTAGFIFSTYVYYKRKEMVPAIIFGSLASFFYLGDIYGSVVSVKIYNIRKTEEFINNLETRLGLIKWLE